jgi:hypothetical protein
MNIQQLKKINDKTEEGKVLNYKYSKTLEIVRLFPFRVKDYLILEHEDPEIDIGLKDFWIHSNPNSLSLFDQIKITPDEQHFDGWFSIYQPPIFISKLKTVDTGEIDYTFTYAAYFKHIFSKYKNEAEYNNARAIQEMNWESQKREMQREELSNRYRIANLINYND